MWQRTFARGFARAFTRALLLGPSLGPLLGLSLVKHPLYLLGKTLKCVYVCGKGPLLGASLGALLGPLLRALLGLSLGALLGSLLVKHPLYLLEKTLKCICVCGKGPLLGALLGPSLDALQGPTFKALLGPLLVKHPLYLLEKNTDMCVCMWQSTFARGFARAFTSEAPLYLLGKTVKCVYVCGKGPLLEASLGAWLGSSLLKHPLYLFKNTEMCICMWQRTFAWCC